MTLQSTIWMKVSQPAAEAERINGWEWAQPAAEARGHNVLSPIAE